ncbi:MAG TPA: glycosyltransferase family 2 protein [Candidatus Acidoferrales bacterium]|jgi:N-acetylglucosaminyl-diphospho-decaprenol L-rhamnosyltransferase|nr:glycosyltransferase family 2 protein [Candidatus Acidoferrales bacterium]
MDVSVIIVGLNAADYIGKCVESVLMQTGVTCETIVVDNGSTDGSLAILKNLKCKVIASDKNLGFGPGNNKGFSVSTGRYAFLLNSDAWLMKKDDLARLCQKMDAEPKWGMAGTKVLSLDGSIQCEPDLQYPAQRHVHRDFSKLPGKIAWILGASMFARREIYEKLGGFDPDFFPIYSEETDLCLRVRESGYEIGYFPEVAVTHVGGSSENLKDPYESSMRKLRGLLKFRQKHYPPEDCVFLAKRDLRRARFRMLWNNLISRWQRPNSRAWMKYRQYRGIWEVSHQYLTSGDHAKL